MACLAISHPDTRLRTRVLSAGFAGHGLGPPASEACRIFQKIFEPSPKAPRKYPAPSAPSPRPTSSAHIHRAADAKSLALNPSPLTSTFRVNPISNGAVPPARSFLALPKTSRLLRYRDRKWNERLFLLLPLTVLSHCRYVVLRTEKPSRETRGKTVWRFRPISSASAFSTDGARERARILAGGADRHGRKAREEALSKDPSGGILEVVARTRRSRGQRTIEIRAAGPLSYRRIEGETRWRLPSRIGRLLCFSGLRFGRGGERRGGRAAGEAGVEGEGSRENGVNYIEDGRPGGREGGRSGLLYFGFRCSRHG
ncbi:hypothetical protein KM043_006073 [Ampulex compressa]|nr:hypothetical protein KM043_006073 [Ampulex compressa]